jgi:nucleoside-diphosphate-sugar epimerase
MSTGTWLVTGYPGFIARRLVAHVAESAPGARIYAVAHPKLAREARRAAETVRNVEVFTGNVADMHLGLPGDAWRTLVDEVTDIFHLAALGEAGAAADDLQRVNIEGTRNALELAHSCSHLRRFTHFSTAYVSGDREGVIGEDELEMGQGFRNAYEETKFRAEQWVRRASARGLPVTVVRPSSVVGPGQGAEARAFRGEYHLALLAVTSPLASGLPLPGEGVAPFHVVPLEYVVRAAFALSRDPRAVGRTFHLVDPAPASARRVHEQVARLASKPIPRFQLPLPSRTALPRMPLLEWLPTPGRRTRGQVNRLSFYRCSETLELLADTGIRCPPLESYLEVLVASVREHHRRQRSGQDGPFEVDDPLDPPRKA